MLQHRICLAASIGIGSADEQTFAQLSASQPAVAHKLIQSFECPIHRDK